MSTEEVIVRGPNAKLKFTSTKSYFVCDGPACGVKTRIRFEDEKVFPESWNSVSPKRGKKLHFHTTECRLKFLGAMGK